MRLGISIAVGIFEKSRRLRIARVSLDMLSPEYSPSRPHDHGCPHRSTLMPSCLTARGGLRYSPPGILPCASSNNLVRILRDPPPLDCRGPRAQNVLPSPTS